MKNRAIKDTIWLESQVKTPQKNIRIGANLRTAAVRSLEPKSRPKHVKNLALKESAFLSSQANYERSVEAPRSEFSDNINREYDKYFYRINGGGGTTKNESSWVNAIMKDPRQTEFPSKLNLNPLAIVRKQDVTPPKGAVYKIQNSWNKGYNNDVD